MFSMQGVGFLVVTMVAWVLIFVFGEDSDFAWRLFLGVGCLPGIVLTILRYSDKQPDEVTKENEHTTNDKDNNDDTNSDTTTTDVQLTVWQTIALEDQLFGKLLGTAGAWFLAYITFYGNTLFHSFVLEAAFGDAETLLMKTRDTCINMDMYLTGYFCKVARIRPFSPKYIQVQGFFAMAILYCVIGRRFEDLKRDKVGLLLFYGLKFFFTNFRPNTTVCVCVCACVCRT